MSGKPELEILHGAEIGQRFEQIASLRMRVFRDWPYLYDGGLEEERRLLQYYLDAPGALAVVVVDQGEAVGFSTAMPLLDESERMVRPFREQGFDPEQVCYLAESILLAGYRGMGFYRRFFELREAHARHLGCSLAAFCAVQRPTDHPLRPPDHQPLDPVWRHFGYVPREDLIAYYPWRDVGHDQETDKPLMFWLKPV
ncbi:MAG: GNAT family N-acetyltransferase [Ectothiorhodospiraceae bacterium]